MMKLHIKGFGLKVSLAILLLNVCCVSWSDEPAIMNEPGNAWESFKQIVSTAEPAGDVIWNLNGVNNKEFKAGSSIRLYSAEGLNVPVLNDLDARLGWMETQGIYGTLSIALDRATGKDIFKYVHVGWAFGWDSDSEGRQFLTGPVVGAKLSF